MSKPLTMKGPCVVCGATDYGESCGGPTICPLCDCGVQPTWDEVKRLRASLAAAEAKLAERDIQASAAESAVEQAGVAIAKLREDLADERKHADEIAEHARWYAGTAKGVLEGETGNFSLLHEAATHIDQWLAAHAARRAAENGETR